VQLIIEMVDEGFCLFDPRGTVFSATYPTVIDCADTTTNFGRRVAPISSTSA
jgi:hypothetical protein